MNLKPFAVLMGMMGLSVALACPVQTGMVANGLFAAPSYLVGVCDVKNPDWLYFQTEVAKTDTPEWTEFYTVAADKLQPSTAYPEGLDPLAILLDELIELGFTEVEEPESTTTELDLVTEENSTEVAADTAAEEASTEASSDPETNEMASEDLGFEAEQYLKFERTQQAKHQLLTIYVHQVLFENEPAKNVYQIGLASSLQ